MPENETTQFFALLISKENISSLAYFNGGVEPHSDAIGDVFVYPLNSDQTNDIVDVVDFFEDYQVRSGEKLNVNFVVNCIAK